MHLKVSEYDNEIIHILSSPLTSHQFTSERDVLPCNSTVELIKTLKHNYI